MNEKMVSIRKITELMDYRYNNRINFVKNYTEMSSTRRKIIENFHKIKEHSFNIFRDLSIDSKFNEINHSKMLEKIFSEKILSLNTQDIANKEYMSVFIGLLEKIKGKKFTHTLRDNFIVKREAGRSSDIDESGGIDLLIFEQNYDKNYCIIIENKITGQAGNQPNQLARYYNISDEMGLTPLAIVYLPFMYQQPPFNEYSEEYKGLAKTIEDELLIILPAIDPVDGNDLTQGFLDKCSKIAEDAGNMTASVCIDQYSKLIKSKGDENQMAKNENKKFIAEILSNSELKKTIEDIVEIWDSRSLSIGELILDYLKESHNFKLNSTNCFGKMIDDDLFIYYQPYKFDFGYGSISGNINKNKAELKEAINRRNEYIDFHNETESFVWGRIKDSYIKEFNDLDSIKKFMSVIIKDFEEEAKSKIKQ